MKRVFISLLMALLVITPVVLVAADSEEIQKNVERVKKNLGQWLPIQTVKYVDDLNLYEVVIEDGTTLFANEEGSRFIVGDMYGIENKRPINLTERAKDQERIAAVKNLNKEDLVIYPAHGEMKAFMYVFTDVDCSYCARLHSEREIYNSNGIEIRYIAWPRCGVNCASYDKIVSVWCAEDPLDAMTTAKERRSLELTSCDNPVKEQYELGVKLGLRGTPFIVLSNGTTIPGYRPSGEIIQLLFNDS